MSLRAVLVAAAGLAAISSLAALAQSGGGGGMSAPDSTAVIRPDALDSQKFLRENVYSKQQPRAVKNLLPSKEEAVKQVSELFNAAHLSCAVTDAALVSQGGTGADKSSKTFEASCSNGIGYFVVAGEQTDAFSCFAAQDTYERDVAAGRQPGIVCGLPADQDVNAMAQTVLTGLGLKCQVSRIRWIGLSAKASTEYTEVACSGGAGYVVTNAVPGSAAPVAAMTCADAGKRGIPCKLTATDQPTVTLKTLHDALAAHNVACTAADENMHYLGQETIKKRYVLELKCPERPKGLVAFIPLEGNTTPFEAIDCATAAKRHISCTLQ